MNLAAPLVVAAVWMLFFRKFPTWKWFQGLIARFPSPLKTLWMGWTECAYCGGFWVALLIRRVAGFKFLTLQLGLSPLMNWYLSTFIDWYLDALTTGLVVLLIIRTSDALAAAAAAGPKH